VLGAVYCLVLADCSAVLDHLLSPSLLALLVPRRFYLVAQSVDMSSCVSRPWLDCNQPSNSLVLLARLADAHGSSKLAVLQKFDIPQKAMHLLVPAVCPTHPRPAALFDRSEADAWRGRCKVHGRSGSCKITFSNRTTINLRLAQDSVPRAGHAGLLHNDQAVSWC
jgi:hypothetical protein